MAETKLEARMVLTTAANPDEAEQLARRLVEERLAGCVTLVPGARSIYRWQGEVESANETLLLVKTGPDQLAALKARVLQLHSYEVPEFLVLDASSGSSRYLEWLHAGLRVP